MNIPIGNAKAGMILTEDVSIAGDILLHKAEVLDDTLITLLKNCGIDTVEISESENGSAAPPDQEISDLPPAPPPAHANAPLPHSAIQTLSAGGFDLPPEIKIVVSSDHMHALLTLQPVSDSGPDSVSSQVITHALDAAGICYGIDHARIESAVRSWREKPDHYEIPDIAIGTEPIPAVNGTFEMQVSCLQTGVECDSVRQLKSFHLVKESFPDRDIVAPGTTIATQPILHQASAGTDIFGKNRDAPATPPELINIAENVSLSDDNRTIYAHCTGVPYLIESTIGVIPVDPNGMFTIEISADHMTARCKVNPPGPEGQLPGKEQLMAQLKDASVHFGINESDITTFLSLCNRQAYPEEPFVVARGLAPINGKDGELVYHFDTTTSLAPAVNSDGSVDYKSISIINTVSKGRELVSLTPPGDGHDGTDVTGKHLPAQPGKPARLPQGKNTAVAPDNPSTLIAGIDGNVRITGGLVEVYEGYVISGNVDYSTGNINYNKTIQITGDVKAGFDIHAGGDLQVNGIIEDCTITAGGSVLCRCGFLGQGRGLIDAKGDVNLSFIKNQTVRSFKSIHIAKEAINCNLYSRSSITLHGKPLSIAGGELHAKEVISLHTVGNLTGIKTLLQVGVDYLMVDELAMIEKQISEATTHFKAVADAFTRYQKNIGTKKRLAPHEQGKLRELTTAFKQTRQKLTVLEERKTIVSGKINHIGDARITIEHTAYPGTLLKFGDRHHYIKEELIGPKTIIYSDHDIKIC